ncbi:hypothetical protein ACJRO7_018119 [Eucalyptus globulus]|uniref:PGG domain-containing protein n=1 Tax=Eucalyptus globulus TaxID=34317 RepID=A0ABD3KSM3_EUCGL
MHPKVYEAAKSGDFDSFETIISGNGEDIFHQTTPKENNILHVAAQYKQVNFIEGLLHWDTPLHLAAKVGSYRAVRAFIDLAKSLHWVVKNGQVNACKELLRKQNLHKDTALHHAIRGGHHWIVKLMIKEDSQLCGFTNAADESPLYIAANRGLSCTTKLILGTFSLSSSHKGPKGLTALHAGISLSLTVWEKIMEKRPEAIREEDDMGWRPLHYVTYFGKVEAVQLLLQHDNSATYDLDKEGQSALHIAAFRGHINVIDELITSFPDACDIINNKGQMALHVAIMGGQVSVVKYILGMPNQEDLINEQDTDGNTALHLAALHKENDIIDILARDKRVDRLAKNKDHLTALDIFSAHEEIGFGARNVSYLLEGSHGISGFQAWFIEHGKKRLEKHFVQGQPSLSTIIGNNIANRDNFDLSKKSIVDVQLLVAALIATVSFTAAVAMPGGYNNDGPNRGMAILAGRADFQAFVLCNSVAFLLSVLAIILHCQSCAFSYRQEPKYIPTVGGCIEVAIAAMGLAYIFGMFTVLTRPPGSTAERVAPYIAYGFLSTLCFIYEFTDPEAHLWLLGSSPRGGYIRKFLTVIFGWAGSANQ